MDGPHIERVAENKREDFLAAEIDQPVSGKHAFGTYGRVFPVRMNGLQKGFRLDLNVAMLQNLALLVENTQVFFVGVQVDPTVMLVLFGVKSYEKAFFAFAFAFAFALLLLIL